MMKLIFFNKIVYHLIMKKMLFLLLFLAGFLGLIIISQPWWPKYLSFQKEIDPNTISEYYDPLARVGIFNNKEVNSATRSTTSFRRDVYGYDK